MFTPQQYRAKAAEYTQLVKTAATPNELREYQDLERSFTTLADNEQWLADNYYQTVHAIEDGQPGLAGPAGKCAAEARSHLADEEEHVLRCLGAAMIMQWDTLPSKLQRELLERAGAVGDLLEPHALKGNIVRFLHKDDENESAGQPLPASDVSQDTEALARWKDEGGAPASHPSGN